MVESNKPIKIYKAGVLSLNVWENELSEETIKMDKNKQNEVSRKIKSFSFQRSYKDKEDNWAQTQNLRTSDLPKLRILLEEAYKDQIVSEN
jgi:hypothetical protein